MGILMTNNKRTNTDIFQEIQVLCSTPGFVHVICSLDFFSNCIIYEEQVGLTGDDLNELMNRELPIRSEMCILIGLLCKNTTFDTTSLSEHDFSELEQKTLSLLKELQHSQIDFDYAKAQEGESKFFEVANGALKENILYGGESFYDFQYIDFAPKKYINDNNWFLENKGYSLNELISVIKAIDKNYHNNISEIHKKLFLAKKRVTIFSDLSSHTLDINYISTISGVEIAKVIKILDSFLYDFSNMNSSFKSESDFNLSNAYPIFRIEEKYILLSRVNLYEALYETPFFWFLNDASYKATASKNRGEFTEQFCKERLEKVFGKHNVFTNINIKDNTNDSGRKKGDNVVGEIDVLVVFGNRAIILQAKSKKLTIEARKGNFSAINNDFKGAIQDSYDQGYSCSELILNPKLQLFQENGVELKINRNFKDIYIVCAISDHYPSLSIQVREMLQYQTTDIIHEPFIMDIFLLDVITEMLDTPLYFLDYIQRRALTFKTLYAQNELVILGYHLKECLNIQAEYTMLTLMDDLASELDAAMIVRRRKHEGKKTPEGILTLYKDTFYGNLINFISNKDKSSFLKLGFFLLNLDSETIQNINESIETLIQKNKTDKKGHSFTLGFTNNESKGIILHTNHIKYSNAKIYFNECFKHMIQKYNFEENYGIYINSLTKKIEDIKFNFIK